MQILSPHHVANLTALKALIEKPELQETSIRIPLGPNEVDLCLRGGLQRGVLHEVFAVPGHETAATGFMAGLASRISGAKQTLWIRQIFQRMNLGRFLQQDYANWGITHLGFYYSMRAMLMMPCALPMMHCPVLHLAQ